MNWLRSAIWRIIRRDFVLYRVLRRKRPSFSAMKANEFFEALKKAYPPEVVEDIAMRDHPWWTSKKDRPPF